MLPRGAIIFFRATSAATLARDKKLFFYWIELKKKEENSLKIRKFIAFKI